MVSFHEYSLTIMNIRQHFIHKTPNSQYSTAGILQLVNGQTVWYIHTLEYYLAMKRDNAEEIKINYGAWCGGTYLFSQCSGRSGVWGQPRLYSKTLSEKDNNRRPILELLFHSISRL